MMASLALIIITAQLSIMYQKRSGQLRMRQEPLRKRIQSIRNKANHSAEHVTQNAEKALSEIQFSIDSLSQFDQAIEKAIVQLEANVQAMFPEDEEDESDHSAQLMLQGYDPRVVLRNVLSRREDVENHIVMLRTDAENIKRNMQRLSAVTTRGETRSDD
jgi:chaperonin cofactor prefoldin